MHLYRFATLLALAASCCLFSGQASSQAPESACSDRVYAINDDVRVAYGARGSSDGEVVVLVPGSGQHAEDWPTDLTQGLLEQGFRVIQLDPRDVGCSTHLDAAGAVDWAALFAQLGRGEKPSTAYSVQDMARDVIAVLDHAKVQKAHIIGASAGATVSGWLASVHPQRVSSLVLLMANSGNPMNPIPADPARMAAVGVPPLATAGIADRRKFLGAMNTALEAGEPTRTREELDRWLDEAAARRLDADGLARTGAAMLAAGDVRKRFSNIKSPTLVVHGAKDPLIPVAAGKEVVEAIPGAEWWVEPTMGHTINANAVEAALKHVGQH